MVRTHLGQLGLKLGKLALNGVSLGDELVGFGQVGVRKLIVLALELRVSAGDLVKLALEIVDAGVMGSQIGLQAELSSF